MFCQKCFNTQTERKGLTAVNLYIRHNAVKKLQEVKILKQSAYKSYDELPLFFNAELVGKVLGVSSTTAYELMHREDFPSIKIGNRLIVSKEKFIEWANKQSDANTTSKSDFVTQAIDFYIGYLRQKKCADFISPILAQSIKSEISSVEENISKMLFKLSVE